LVVCAEKAHRAFRCNLLQEAGKRISTTIPNGKTFVHSYMRLTALILFITVSLHSQNRALDSLFNVLKTAKEDTNKVNLLHALGSALNQVGDYTKASEFSNQSLKLAQQLNYKVGIANSLLDLGNISQNNNDYGAALKYFDNSLAIYTEKGDKEGIGSAFNGIGTVYWSKGEYPNALGYFSKGLEIFKKIGNKRRMIAAYSNIGAVYHIFGKYPEALKFQLIALKLVEELEDKSQLIKSYNNIALIYISMQNYPLAVNYFSKGLKLAQQLGDKKAIGTLYGNIGNLHSKQENYSEALKFHEMALKIKKEINDRPGIAVTYHALGLVYDKQSKYHEALKNYLEAIAIAEQLDLKFELAGFYTNLGILNTKQKQFESAEKYLLKSLSISKEINSKEDIAEDYRAFAQLDSLKGNIKSAFKNYRLYVAYRDSMLNEENKEQILKAQMSFDFDKKESQLKVEQSKKDAIANEKSRNKDLIAIALSLTVVLISVIGLLFFRQNKLKTKQKTMQLEQKLLRSQMNPHFIFNCLQVIQNYITDEKAEKYLVSFGALTRSVLESSRLENISLKKEIALLNHYLDLQKVLHENRFEYTINISSNINTDNISLPPMLCQPFIENSIEHGFRDVISGGKIEINITAPNDYLEMEIIDNGSGLRADSKKDVSSLATEITTERINLLNKNKRKKLSFTITEAFPTEVRKGVKVNFRIPIN
jgi:tetratricopeptide (TPR) repeat protein